MFSKCLQVLFFENIVQRSEFVEQLQSDLKEMSQNLKVTEMSEKELLKEAVNKEQRAQIVETFFRHAFAKVETGYPNKWLCVCFCVGYE